MTRNLSRNPPVYWAKFITVANVDKSMLEATGALSLLFVFLSLVFY